MKKIRLLLVAVPLLSGLTICGHATGNNDSSGAQVPADGQKILVAYFSCTGTTETVASYIADETGGKRYKILPETPYTPAD
ncbi:MAG: hypothetical protein LBD44_02965, partial [Spirochaetaceae bacterium]|nr:hypothetical protein [Spirochaetaceae bacterium]